MGNVHVEDLSALSRALTALIAWVLQRSRQPGLKPGSVVVLVQQRGRRRTAAGWFEPERWGHRHGYAAHHEIAVAAEEVGRGGPEGVAAIVLHELAHLLCYLGEVADTSRGGRYHNARFKAAAEALGLTVGWDELRGFADTTLGEDLNRAVRARGLLPARLFKLERLDPGGKGERQRRSWACSCEGRGGRPLTVSVWRERELKARCIDCGELFMPVERA